MSRKSDLLLLSEQYAKVYDESGEYVKTPDGAGQVKGPGSFAGAPDFKIGKKKVTPQEEATIAQHYSVLLNAVKTGDFKGAARSMMAIEQMVKAAQQRAAQTQQINSEDQGDASAVNMGPGDVLEVQPDGQHPDAPARDENAEDQQSSLVQALDRASEYIGSNEKTQALANIAQQLYNLLSGIEGKLTPQEQDILTNMGETLMKMKLS